MHMHSLRLQRGFLCSPKQHADQELPILCAFNHSRVQLASAHIVSPCASLQDARGARVRSQALVGNLPSASSLVLENRHADSSASTPKPELKKLPGHWEKQMETSAMGKKRVLQPYLLKLAGINALEPTMKASSDEQLRAKTDEFKARLAAGDHLDSLLQEAFAVVREAARRVLNMRHFDSQLVGGMVLHDGQIAEMATGEGKTLVATLPVYLNALDGKGVHVITVNDYLAARDAEWMGKIYRFLGLTCASAQGQQELEHYKHAYSCDITYVTGQQLGFSYLGDNSCGHESQLVLPPTYNYALVDEADSILIDESRNPMITSLSLSSDKTPIKVVDKVVLAVWEYVEDWRAQHEDLLNNSLAQARSQGFDDATLKRQEEQYREIANKQCSFLYSIDKKVRTCNPTTAGLFVFAAGLEFMGVNLSPTSTSASSSDNSSDTDNNDDEAAELSSFEQDLLKGAVSGRSETIGMLFSDPQTLQKLLLHPGARAILMKAPKMVDKLLADDVAVAVLERELRRVVFTEAERQQRIALKGGNARQRTAQLNTLWEGSVKWGTLINTGLQVYEFYDEGKEYVVRDREVVLVDSSTGRLKDNTRMAGGVHQAIEAKERVELKDENRTVAQITFQVFFRFYNKLAGMTGTAAPAAGELFELYRLKVVQIPTNKPRLRIDRLSRIYLDPEGKFRGLVQEVMRSWATRRPLLIGTGSVSESELILDVLQKYTCGDARCQAIQLLNAKPSKVRIESQIISQAGLPGSVTISTNMAGRGTDIVLGGSPEGLTKLVLLRLLYRRLMTDADAETIPSIPLQPFSVFDRVPLRGSATSELSALMRDYSSLPESMRLPPVLLQAILAPLMLLTVGSSHNLPYNEVNDMVEWVMDKAFALHRESVQKIRAVYGDKPIQELEFGVCVASIAEELMRNKEDTFSSSTSGQKFAVQAAVLLWLYLDQTCARYAEEVRSVGGLLVMGTSVQESQRVELQLRGRAGRQGDPGETIMMCDINDPYFMAYGSTLDSVRALKDTVPYLEDKLVIKTTQLLMGNTFQQQRLDGKKYDVILEEYRGSLYALRRFLLTGSAQQRTQVVYMFIQHMVDSLCSQYLDPALGPSSWLAHSIPASRVAAGGRSEGGLAPLLTPLEALLTRLHLLVNDESVVSKTQVEFKAVQDGVVRDVTIQNLLSLFQRGKGNNIEGAADKEGGSSKSSGDNWISVPLAFDEVPVLRPPQVIELGLYLTAVPPARLAWFGGGGEQLGMELSLPRAPYSQSFKQALAMSTHRRIFGMEGDAGCMGVGSADLDPGDLPHGLPSPLLKRPVLKGQYAHKVHAVRNYLGVCMLHAFEMRRLSFRSLLLRQGFAVMDMDAETQLWDAEQSILINIIDALWSNFLEEVDKLKKSVSIRSSASTNPLNEFRIEANRSFLSYLDVYRETVVEQVFCQRVSASMPIASSRAGSETKEMSTKDFETKGLESGKGWQEGSGSGGLGSEDKGGNGGDDEQSPPLC